MSEESPEYGVEPIEIGQDEIVFLFTFPPIQSAFKRHGSGNGMRVQIEIPESDIAEAVALQALTQCILEARVRVVEDHRENVSGSSLSRRKAKRRK